MKAILIALCLFAAAVGYTSGEAPHRRDVSGIKVAAEPAPELNALKQLVHRNRRDVSHLNLDYLPPVNNEYLPPPVKKIPKPSQEYLPPVPTYLPPLEQVETEAPAVVTEAATTEAPTEAAPEETAVLKADGYHYKVPAVVPDLAPSTPAPVTRDYLPPVEDDVVVEGGTEEAKEDGYYYRAVRRRRYRF